MALSACGEQATLPVSDGFGPKPTLPPPNKTLIPTVNVAPRVGWRDAERPVAATGLAVDAFATGLEHPRWLYLLPSGDVLVAESNAPPRPKDAPAGIRSMVMKQMMKRAGAAVPSANRITLLRDADGDGRAEVRSVFLEGLNSPFGMTLVGDEFYVANTDALVRYRYSPGQLRITASPTTVTPLPGGKRNHHWTKNVIASRDGRRLYVTVGSNSNVAEHGMEEEKDRAAILEVDPVAGAYRVFASGLRNPNGMDWQPETGSLWTVVNERDEIGSDLVPDYLTEVHGGAFYGWPYSYFGAHVDERVKPPRPELVATARVPDYALGPHTASLGLSFYQGMLLPSPYRHGAFIGQHGSWNRKPHSGYKVIFIPFVDGHPSGAPVDVLTGFLDNDGNARGRPVGVISDAKGAVLVADDVGNVIWRITPAASRAGDQARPRDNGSPSAR
nr:sorbosone dehydrogenase family protein [Lysobacter niastensis]